MGRKQPHVKSLDIPQKGLLMRLQQFPRKMSGTTQNLELDFILPHLVKAIFLFYLKQMPPLEALVMHNNMGWNYYIKGELDKALHHLKRKYWRS